MGHAPGRPPVRSQFNGTAAGTHVTTLCDSVAPGACDNPTPCQPVVATRWNFTLRVGPNASATVPFDVYVYVPRSHAGGMYTLALVLGIFPHDLLSTLGGVPS